jgi:hypothetical protein
MTTMKGTSSSPDEFTLYSKEVIQRFVGAPLKDDAGQVIGEVTKAWSTDGGRMVHWEADVKPGRIPRSLGLSWRLPK